MVNLFILGVAFLVAFILIAKWYVGADPKTLLKGLKWVGFGAVMVVVAWLLVSGKLWAALAALPAMLMWFLRLFTGLRYVQMLKRMINLGGGGGWSSPGSGSGQGGQNSGVRTRFVDMHLDHETGRVWGEVLEGRFQGRALDDLTLDELADLLAEAQVDPDSARVVESYLDRRAPDWRTRQSEHAHHNAHHNTSAPAGSAMSRREALKVLGLSDDATPDDIKAAHRRLMAQVHPDHGGSDYLAQQINQAKDVLLSG